MEQKLISKNNEVTVTVLHENVFRWGSYFNFVAN